MTTPAGWLILPMGRTTGRMCRAEPRERNTPYQKTIGQHSDRAGIIGDSFVDLNVKAPLRRYGAERADPLTPGISGVEDPRPGEETARKDGQRRERSADQKRIG